MSYSHYGNGVCKGAISIAQWGLLSDCYKVNPIGRGGNILVIVMGFVDMLGPCMFISGKVCLFASIKVKRKTLPKIKV